MLINIGVDYIKASPASANMRTPSHSGRSITLCLSVLYISFYSDFIEWPIEYVRHWLLTAAVVYAQHTSMCKLCKLFFSLILVCERLQKE